MFLRSFYIILIILNTHTVQSTMFELVLINVNKLDSTKTIHKVIGYNSVNSYANSFYRVQLLQCERNRRNFSNI